MLSASARELYVEIGAGEILLDAPGWPGIVASLADACLRSTSTSRRTLEDEGNLAPDRYRRGALSKSSVTGR
jgi:hypothetical protein